MVGAKDILLLGVELASAVHLTGHQYESENHPRPPSVENTDQVKLLFKNNGNEQQGEYQAKRKREHHETIVLFPQSIFKRPDTLWGKVLGWRDIGVP
jgi:hypothetical protein